MENLGTANEVAFNELKPTDRLLLKTKNSQYEFFILDPVEKRGLLAGGSLGNQQREAILMGTLAENTKSLYSDCPVVKLGDRVLFALVDTGDAETFFTTGVQELVHERVTDGRRASAVTANRSSR